MALPKKKVTLDRKLPLDLHTLTALSSKWASPEHKVPFDVVNSLGDMLEAELLKDDHRLRADENHPDSIISCNITEFVAPRAQTVSATGN